MKKNGFTLVELLAVIAILAILVIIALPNVMGMFNNAKKNSFTTEVKQIYKLAQQEWISDSMFSTTEKEYGRCDGCSYKELSLTGRSEIQYYIKINKAGNVVKYYVNDGTYTYTFDNPGSSLQITDITDANITQSTSNTLFNLSEVYVADNLDEIRKGMYVSSGYSTYQEAMNKLGSNSYIKCDLIDGKVNKMYVGFIYNGNAHNIDADKTYEENKAILQRDLGSVCSNTIDNLYEGAVYKCNVDNGATVKLYDDNSISVYHSGIYCGTYIDSAGCGSEKR